MDELLEIGKFSSLSGLTIPALRHYDELGILEPAEVDPRTSYRRYHRDQLDAASVICQLRSVDLPVEEVRAVLEAPDGEAARAVLARHQQRLTERAATLARMLETAHVYLGAGVPAPPPAQARPVQVMLAVRDRRQLVEFYATVFGWTFDEPISSFSLGAYHAPSFFLVTLEDWHGGAPAAFGVLVPDVEESHRRALAAGGTEVEAPTDHARKPRSSIVDDPSGNRIQLSQG
jgi:DNA-binding transcriptional MerR regulator/predicted enzyme related to lactoylglutathione lyase